MKITFLLTWGDEMGGTEQAVYTQATHLAPRHTVEVLSVVKTRPEPFFGVDDRVPVRYLVDRTGPVPRPVRDSGLGDDECRRLAGLPSDLISPVWEKTFDALTDVEMKRALRTIDTDVLITTSPALMSAVADLVPSRVITIQQEHRPSQLRGGTGEPLLLRAPEIDALVVLTERTRQWLEESLGAAAPRLAAIPNAIPEGFRPRSSLSGRTIVMPRRLVPDKQVDHAIQAFAKVLPDHPGWRLRVFGDGPQLAALRGLVQGLGLHDSVEILGPSQHMTEEWAKASLTILPSQDGEALPLVLLEAFAAGVPAVAYDIVTGPAEIIRHGEDGLLVPPNDIEGLAAAISRLMGDEELLRTFGENAYDGAARFSADTIVAQWESLFEELVARRDDPRRMAERADRMAHRTVHGGAGRFHVAVAADRTAPSTGDQRAREDELAAADANLIRAAGRLSEVRDDLRAPDITLRNFTTVVDVLEEHAIPFVVLRGRDGVHRHRVAVDSADQAKTRAVLAQAYRGRPVYAELLKPRTHAPAVLLGERLDQAGDVAGLRVFWPVTTSSRTLRYGPAYGCDLEFWQKIEEADGGDGQFTAPLRPTGAGSSLPTLTPDATLRVADRELPTLAPFAGRLVTDVAFPIDAVYTWVDDSDPRWQERRAARRAELGLAPEAAGDESARFRNRDELRYSLRSLAMFAPWVRKVYLVTDDQTPEWLDTDHPGIEVVSHSRIFADQDNLPTFNSHAIESQLHRIEGLAEHFLYLNDDVFFGRPVGAELFFQSNGASRFFWSPTTVPLGEATEEDEGYFAAAKNNRRLLEDRFGTTVANSFLHAPHALRKSVLERITEEFAEAAERTAATPLRGWQDISVPSSLHHHYGYLTGTAIPGGIRCAYANVGAYDRHPELTRLLTLRRHDVFCLGEAPDAEVPEDEQARVVETFLKAYFPVPSPYERTHAPQKAQEHHA
ncbi:stealth conserved region 3 domain-containing protein [Streptomyces beihaiensis]|uniref:Stealth conserved region 3 domain-containing protein n=1 Tax=Streptomyces beihaiensis TaxID=2984495 RepID=A0ABT3TQB3_9ACTN|nr:stealth conserved region 3 domain-containing protein [Streptomyces beihaiensis]MCX3059192.1 stealth conserved region 3 domain-containing protein [Streptomyces beihaiensis]